MSIATQISRLTTLRNNIRTKLINLGIISDSSADLEDCYTAINGITGRSSSDLTASGATVTAPAGYYASAASKAVASGSATTPATTITSQPTISVSASGLITATNSKSQSVTPTVSAGYVSSGTAGTITVDGSKTQQLTTKAATTYTPTTTNQTIASGTYLTGTQTIAGDANLVAANIASGVTIFGVTGTHSGGGNMTIIETPDSHGGTVLEITGGIDLSNDTVTAATLLQGYTAHDASGTAIVGTATGGGGLDSAMHVGNSMPTTATPNVWLDTSDSNASVTVSKVWYGTQSSYNDISTKDSNTLYCIMSEAQTVAKMYRGSTLVYEPEEFATVTGTAPLTLTNAEVGPIKSLIQYGKCTVSNGEIICNNGAVKVDSKNRLYVDGTPEEILIGGNVPTTYDLNNATFIDKYYINASGVFSGEGTSEVYVNIPSIPGSTYTWTFTAGRKNNRRIHEFSSMEVSQSKTASQNGWLRQKALIAQNDITIGNTTTISWTASNDAVSFSLAVDATDSNTVLTGIFASYSVAYAENLFAVGDYKDTHDIITGKVHRECTICKYDGTQTIGSTYLSSTGSKDIGAVIVYPLENGFDEYDQAQELNVLENHNTINVTAEVSDINFKATYISEEI